MQARRGSKASPGACCSLPRVLYRACCSVFYEPWRVPGSPCAGFMRFRGYVSVPGSEGAQAQASRLLPRNSPPASAAESPPASDPDAARGHQAMQHGTPSGIGEGLEQPG